MARLQKRKAGWKEAGRKSIEQKTGALAAKCARCDLKKA
jgi:hypothetical protein